jgi:hypothetical protein
VGAIAPLRWDERGSAIDGRIELWCIEDKDGKLRYSSAGVIYDVSTDSISGDYIQCGP